MNWKHLMLCAAATLLAGSIHAQGKDGDEPAPEDDLADADEVESEISEFFLAYDSDRDGKVTIGEVKKTVADSMETNVDDPAVAIQIGQAVSLMVAADVDDDGGVSKTEYRDLRQKQLKEPHYKPALSKADVEVLRKEVYGPVYKMVMDAADANADGKLSREEYKALVEDAAVFDTADTNKDGFIDKAEMDADWVRELGDSFQLPKDLAKQPEKQPDAGKEPPVVGEKPPTPEKQPPVVEEKPPTPEKQPPVVEEKPPVPEKKPSVIEEKPPVVEEKPEPPQPAEVIDSVYNKAGRNWLTKQTSKMGSLENVSYVKVEVISVANGEAVVKTQVLNKDKQPLLNQPARETTRALKEEASTEVVADLGTETIKVGDKDFACNVTEVKRGQATVKTWHSTKYPGLTVKVVTKSGTVESTNELAEFNE